MPLEEGTCVRILTASGVDDARRSENADTGTFFKMHASDVHATLKNIR